MAESHEAAAPVSLARESSALSSSTKQMGEGTRFNYRSYGPPALNQAIARSMGAEYLPEVNMVKMRIA